MPDNYRDDKLRFRIANSQDDTFADTDHRAPDHEVVLKPRGSRAAADPKDPDQRYARHTLVGINVFALRLMKEYKTELGLREDPLMDPIERQDKYQTAIEASLDMATRETATVELLSIARDETSVKARVRVVNKAGHKLPSGVGFRRAFLEVQILDRQERPIWASGRTNRMGVILDGITEKPLETEFFQREPGGRQAYQPYHATITRGDQVQVYEELYLDKAEGGVFTTSFLSLARSVKDTRLMPRGWSRDGPHATETMPNGGFGKEVGRPYFDGSGSDELSYEPTLGPKASDAVTMTVRLFYQSIPPYYLKERFTTAPNGPFANNLRDLLGGLDVDTPGDPIGSWKLLIAETRRAIGP
jgi:hypothetical protein